METARIVLHSTSDRRRNTVLTARRCKEGMPVATHTNTRGWCAPSTVKYVKLAMTSTPSRALAIGNDTWRTIVGDQRQHRRPGRRSLWTRNRASRTFRSRIRPRHFGGQPSGNNLCGDSLVCGDRETGHGKWHFRSCSSSGRRHVVAPILLYRRKRTGDQGGRRMRASSRSLRFRIDQRAAIWPIDDGRSTVDVPTEKTSPTQPFPTSHRPMGVVLKGARGSNRLSPRRPCAPRALETQDATASPDVQSPVLGS